MTLDDYGTWLALARHHSRRADEATDLLHDALLIALSAGREDLAGNDRAWFSGVLRRRAAFLARTEVRRRTREERVARSRRVTDAVGAAPETSRGSGVLEHLSRGSRAVAVLALHGLGRSEITAALGLSDAAFRQRLTALRKALGRLESEAVRDEVEVFRSRTPAGMDGLDLGLLRRALLESARRTGALGTHDPDGHLLLLQREETRTSRNSPGRQRPPGGDPAC